MSKLKCPNCGADLGSLLAAHAGRATSPSQGGGGAHVAMGTLPKSIPPVTHPHLWRWGNEFGTVQIRYGGQTRSFIPVLDEGGVVWRGPRGYPTLDAALADAEAGVARWMGTRWRSRMPPCPASPSPDSS